MSILTATKQAPNTVNGIDVDYLRQTIEVLSKEPAKALTTWKVTSQWTGQTGTRATVEGYRIGGEWIKRNFEFETDEPFELGGSNLKPNPQEYLIAALNACMMVGYSAVSALMGVELEKLEIETEGDIDLRGFLGIDSSVPNGYESLKYTVKLKGKGTPEQFKEIHRIVMATSPNFYNISRPIELAPKLVIEK